MRRLIIACIITIILGVSIYCFTTFIFKDKEEVAVNKEDKNSEETYEFDISYGTKINLEDMEEVIANNKDVVILIGNKEEDATKKVSSLLGNVENVDSLNIYYLEREEMVGKEDLYQSLFVTYPELSNYLNFTPVILVFKDNTLMGGLPGGVEAKNIINFLEYTEVL